MTMTNDNNDRARASPVREAEPSARIEPSGMPTKTAPNQGNQAEWRSGPRPSEADSPGTCELDSEHPASPDLAFAFVNAHLKAAREWAGSRGESLLFDLMTCDSCGSRTIGRQRSAKGWCWACHLCGAALNDAEAMAVMSQFGLVAAAARRRGL